MPYSGSPYLDHNGMLHVRSASSGYAAKLRFKEPFLAFTTKQVHKAWPLCCPTLLGLLMRSVHVIRCLLGVASRQSWRPLGTWM